MKTRQAIFVAACFPFLFGLSACSSQIEQTPTSTSIPPRATPSSTITFTPSPIPPTFTPTPLACLTQPGQVKQDAIPGTNPSQEFLIYLPPCYDEESSIRYPTLYLLHGLTYNQDQWVRLGVPTTLDDLIHSGQSVPFIVVFPDDHYWNAPAGATFGDRFINMIIPYVDEHYHTIADREHRALGGLSLGGGLTIKLGFEHTDLFGSLGLHSPAILKEDAPYLTDIVRKIPQESRPRLWFDIGDADRELGNALSFDEILTEYYYIHEFHLFIGDHSEKYWSAHVVDYLRWYALGWQEASQQ